MTEEILGHGKLVVEVQQNVDRAMAEIEQRVARAQRKLDDARATMTLDANLRPLERKVREAEAKVEEWRVQAERAAELGLDDRKATRNLRDWERKLHERRTARDEVTLDTEKARAQLAQLQRLERAHSNAVADMQQARIAGEKRVADAIVKENQQAADKFQADWDAALSENEKRNQRAAKKFNDAWLAAHQEESKRNARAAADFNKAWDAAHKQEESRNQRSAARYNADWENALKEDWKRSAQRTQKVAADLAQADNLERQYANLHKRRARAETTLGKSLVPGEVRYHAELDSAQALKDMAVLEAKLRAVGRDPVKIKTKLDAMHGSGDKNVGEGLASMVAGLSDTTVRMGPFTTTIAGAVRVLALLGPVITGVVGALGALVGALGAGIVGAAGAATAGMAGFGLILGSTFLIGRTLMGGFKNIIAAQKAYDKQAQATGKNSKEAKAKLDALNNTIKNAGPGARQAYEGYSKLRTEFQKLASQSKPAFIADLNQALTTGRSLLRTFGPEVTRSFTTVSRGFQTAMAGLRSGEAQRTIGTIFDNGLAALPKFGAGLGNLARAAGNVAAAFSRMLSPLGGGFEKWTQGILSVTQNSKRMNGIVNTTVGAMRSVGHFAQAAGRMLATFFGASVKPGVSLIDSMTAGLDKMTARMQTVGGGKKLSDFFGNSVNTVEKLYQALKPITQVFMEWSTIMRPFTDALLTVLGIIGRVVSAMAKFGPTRAILESAFGIFILGTLAGKLKEAWGAAKLLYGVLKTMGAVKLGSNILNALTGGGAGLLGGGINKLAGRNIFGTVAKDAAEAGGQLALFEGAGAAAAGAGSKVASGAERAAGGLARTAAEGAGATGAVEGVVGTEAMFGPWGIAAAGATALVAGGFLLLSHRSHDYEDALKATAAAQKAYAGSLRALPQTENSAAAATLSLHDANRQVADAQKAVNKLRREGKTNTEAYKVAEDNLHGTLLNQIAVQQQRKQAFVDVLKAQKATLASDNKIMEGTRKQLSVLRGSGQEGYGAMFDKAAAAAKRAGVPLRDYIKQMDVFPKDRQRLLDIAGATDKVTTATRQQAQAAAVVATSTINQQRAMKGLPAMANSAAQSYARLIKSIGGGRTAKLSMQFDSAGAAEKAGKLADNISSKYKGGSQYVINVIAHSKSATDTMRRLNAFKFAVHEMPVSVSGKNALITQLAQIAHYKLPKKWQDLDQHGKETVIRGLQEIIRTKFGIKTQPIGERGSGAVMAVIRTIAGMGLPDKSMSIHGDPNPFLSTIGGLLSHAWTAIVNIVGRKSGMTGAAFARGGVTDKPEAAVVGRPSRGTTADRIIARAAARAENKGARRTTGGRYATPTLLVGEESRREYVIATNPAYRKRNEQFLGSAAQEFGYNLIPAARRGRSGLPVPKKYTSGGVDPASAQKVWDNWRTELQKREQIVKDSQRTMHQDKTGPKNEGKAAAKARRKRYNKAKDTADHARKGTHGFHHSLKELRAATNNAKARYQATASIQSQIDDWTTKAETERSRMSKASTLYAAGDAAQLDPYTSAKTARLKDLQHIWNLLNDAKKYATPGSKWALHLEHDQAAIEDDQASSALEAPDARPEMDLESLIASLGKTGELIGLQNTLAQAQALTPEVADDPNTANINEHTVSLTDDLAASTGIQKFYADLYNLVKDNAGVPLQVKTELLQALTGANSDVQSVRDSISQASDSGSTDPGIDTAQVRDTERYNAMRDYGSNPQAINLSGAAGAGYMPASPGNIGSPRIPVNDPAGSFAPANLSGAPMAAPNLAAPATAASTLSPVARAASVASPAVEPKTNNVTINNTFATVPPDPHTWSQGVGFEMGGIL